MQHYYQEIDGFFWFEEAYRRLASTLPHDRPSVFVEVGSFQGRSTAWLGVEIVNSGKPVTLVSVDSFESWEAAGVPRGDDLALLFAQNTEPLRFALRERFQAILAPSVATAATFADGSVDVVFLDAAHDYDSVKADILAWWPKLRPGGFMGGDDFNMLPVMRAVTEQFAPSGYILCHGWADNPEPTCWPSWLARKA